MSDVKIVRGLELTPVEKMIALAIAQHQFGIPNPVIDEFHASLAKSISTMFTERGMVVVPKKPTKEMVEAGDVILAEYEPDWSDPARCLERIYRAMWGASPQGGQLASKYFKVLSTC